LRFLKHAQETINPSVTAADVREMLIQHILTEEIFAHVFDNADFHRQNNVARELYRLEETFFTGAVKHRTLEGLKSYYAAIRSTAALVSSHHEKQNFLKIVYENFYKVYNRKAADRLGVIYTPNEIVRFMVEAGDWLCQRHFSKQLIDRNVEILDPAVGTGTFIAELIEHFRGQPAKLKYKYREELHANEVAILPYYVANLNIEATYAALTGEYEEYPNLCFVDTLDNIAGLRQRGRQGELFGAVSEENVTRIKRQNARKISVIIGNPPYNANQLNENENNKNREYPAIDKRIKETYIAASDAQKTKLYDPYVRFFRWASDRVDENGIVAFVSNSSFVHKPSLDGVRKTLAEEYADIWIVDLKGDARTAGERRRREGGNIFGNQIRVGIAISFLIRKRSSAGCRIHYQAVPDYARADEKTAFLAEPIWERDFEELRPDDAGNWVGVPSAEFNNFLPLADRATKSVRVAAQERAIFRLYSLGIRPTAMNGCTTPISATCRIS
jgi:predicted helicase